MSPFGEYCVNASSPINIAIKKYNNLTFRLLFFNIAILDIQAKNGFIMKIRDSNAIEYFLLLNVPAINLIISMIAL